MATTRKAGPKVEMTQVAVFKEQASKILAGVLKRSNNRTRLRPTSGGAAGDEDLSMAVTKQIKVVNKRLGKHTLDRGSAKYHGKQEEYERKSQLLMKKKSELVATMAAGRKSVKHVQSPKLAMDWWVNSILNPIPRLLLPATTAEDLAAGPARQQHRSLESHLLLFAAALTSRFPGGAGSRAKRYPTLDLGRATGEAGMPAM
jgi:hypothetical protein